MASSGSKPSRQPPARPSLESRTALHREFSRRGILLKQDPRLPDVVGFLSGGPIRGSWWSHPGAHALFDALQEFTEGPDLLAVKLVGGKDTYVHRRLWPALLGAALEGAAWQREGLSPAAARTSSPGAAPAKSSPRAAERPRQSGYLSPMNLVFPGGIIRPWRLSDAKALPTLADNRKVWINLLDRFPHPYTPADARRWVEESSHLRPVTDFALEVDGRLAGGIGLRPGEDVHAHIAEIGYWLGEPYWGRGIATAAVGAFTDHALAGFKMRRLFARVFAWNPASARVLEKCGYQMEGRLRDSAIKDGKVVDELLYARIGRQVE